MATFRMYNHFGKTGYEFVCESGKLVSLSTLKYINPDVKHNKLSATYTAYAAPAEGQNAISRSYFEHALREACVDDGFTDWEKFAKELCNDTKKLESLRKIILANIATREKHINFMRSAITA